MYFCVAYKIMDIILFIGRLAKMQLGSNLRELVLQWIWKKWNVGLYVNFHMFREFLFGVISKQHICQLYKPWLNLAFSRFWAHSLLFIFRLMLAYSVVWVSLVISDGFENPVLSDLPHQLKSGWVSSAETRSKKNRFSCSFTLSKITEASSMSFREHCK